MTLNMFFVLYKFKTDKDMRILSTFLIGNMCHKIVLLFFLCVYGQIGYAQLSFSIYGEFSGKCDDLDRGLVNAYIKSYQARITSIPKRSLCEEMRQMIGGVSATSGGCTYRIVCTPCVGREISTGSSSLNSPLNSNVLGPNQGSTYFYTNQATEIRQWEEDTDRLLGIIGNKGASVGLTCVETGDEAFDKTLIEDTNIAINNRIVKVLSKGTLSKGRGIYIGEGNYMGISHDELKAVDKNANQENVNNYISKVETFAYGYFVNPQDLEIALPNLFKTASGFDIEKIMNKLPNERTGEERQAVDDYNEFVKQMCGKIIDITNEEKGTIGKTVEKKQIDMAVLAFDCYNDDKKGYIQSTDYRQIHSMDIDENNYPIRSLMDAVNICNSTEPETGFHAELYFNETTNEYTIAIEGTNGLKDWLSNISQGIGIESPQHNLANTIANVIKTLPEDININITGHSLGGSLASLIGLITEKPTYTYNAEGVSDNILEDFGLLEKQRKGDYNITAYHSFKDVLTLGQKANSVLQTINPVSQTIAAVRQVDKKNVFAAEAVGKEENIGFHGWHGMEPMIQHFMTKHMEKQQDWSRANNIQYAVKKQLNSGELFRREAISIKSYQE